MPDEVRGTVVLEPATAPSTKAEPTPAAEDTLPTRHFRGEGPDRRLSRIDRRVGLDRRQQAAAEAGYDGPERRKAERRVETGLERRRGPGRRRADDRRSAEEGEMNVEQFEFIQAVEMYKKVNKRLYPTWTEILEIVRQLGYRKIKPREIHLDNVPEPKIHVFTSDED